MAVIQSIRVEGFKSIAAPQSIELRPLTVLAGANSSGKSSIMQPVLLMKQTLESQYDPGALRLDGPNVRLASADEALSRSPRRSRGFSIELGWSTDKAAFYFAKEPGTGFEIARIVSRGAAREFAIHRGMDSSAIQEWVDANSLLPDPELAGKRWRIGQDRFFLVPEIVSDAHQGFPFEPIYASAIRDFLRNLIHLPGLRGSPERLQPRAAVNGSFPGVFQQYAPSVLDHWQETRAAMLEGTVTALTDLGLTSKVATRRVSDAAIEILVNRLPSRSPGRPRDMINIAGAGLGLSQVLPVLVALYAAAPGQTLYIEEPEAHLHPLAQVRLAKFLADTAKRGVCVIIETHSALLLRGIQTSIARKRLNPILAKAHWFQRSPGTGETRIRSADFDERGAFGDWPVDFLDVTFDADKKYLEAIGRVAPR